MLKEHDAVTVTGTIVHIYADGRTCEVELQGSAGATVKMSLESLKKQAEQKTLADAIEMYNGCRPKQFGNLHERMMYLMHIISSDEGKKVFAPGPGGVPAGKATESVLHATWNAVYDLQTEVMHYSPEKSYGQGQIVPIPLRALRKKHPISYPVKPWGGAPEE